jgi:hypothetical protein
VKLHRSTDAGKSWDEIGKPTYPKRPEGAEEVNDAGQKIPWNVEQIWAVAAGGQDEPGVLWCGTIPGGLFKSEDDGDNWVLNRPLWDNPSRKQWFGGGADYPGIHSICVDPRDSGKIAVGVSCGGVWVTDDSGETWRCQASGMRAAYMPPDREHDPNTQDPHCIVQCPSAPDVFWAQHHNGIFRSTDGTLSWHELQGEPSSFGFATRVHPTDPDTAWFVPAIKDEQRVPVGGRFIVTRTRDGGQTFETLSQGLPAGPAYDLVYRHGLDVDPSGQRLALGSTTGSLWLSEDGGDTFQALSNHLPPVYAVCFA